MSATDPKDLPNDLPDGLRERIVAAALAARRPRRAATRRAAKWCLLLLALVFVTAPIWWAARGERTARLDRDLAAGSHALLTRVAKNLLP